MVERALMTLVVAYLVASFGLIVLVAAIVFLPVLLLQELASSHRANIAPAQRRGPLPDNVVAMRRGTHGDSAA